MKKIVLLLVFISFVFGLASCNKEVDLDLESPANVAILNGVVSWDDVDQADSYIVFIDTTEVAVSTTSYDLNDQELAAGSYSITVVAVKDDKVSVPSSVLTYVVEAAVSSLPAPTNVAINDGVLTWGSVVGATSYVVHVGTQSFTVTAATLDLNSESIAVGSYSVYVTASDGTNVSVNSATVNYVVELNLNQDAIALVFIQRMDPTFTLDLEEDDFEDVYEYNNYLVALDMAQAFSSSAVSMGMTPTRAINLINDANDMVAGMSRATSLDDMMMELEIFEDYDMDAADLANVLYELAFVLLDSRIRDIELTAMNRVEMISGFEDQITLITGNADFIAVYDYVKTFADPSEYAALDMLFSGESYDLIMVLMDISGGYTVNPMYYTHLSDEEQGYILDLISITDSMNADVAGALFLANIYKQQNNLYDLEMYVSMIEDFDMYGDSSLEEMAMYEDLIILFTDNKDDVIDSLTVVIDFALTVKNTVPQNSIDLIDEFMSTGEISTTEMFTIKDELVLVLQNALPEATDFETIYNTMFIIGGSLADYDMTDYMDYAELLGQSQYLSMSLMLNFIGDIDEALMTDAIDILMDAQDEYGNMDFEQNPEVAIDFVLFVVDYLQTFMIDNAVQITALEALVTDEYLEEIYVMVLDLAIDQIENDQYINADYAMMMTDFLEDMKLEFDTYKALVDMFGDTATDVLSYMIDSEARLLKIVINLGQTQEPTTTEILMDLTLIINEVNNIDIEIFDELDDAQLQVLFDAARLPLKTAVEASGSDLNFDTLYASLTPELKTIILNVISLQSDLLAEADDLSYLTLLPIVTNTYLTSPEMGAYVVAIMVASNTFTTVNEALVFDTIDILFDDLLSNSDVLAATNMIQQDVVYMKADVVSEFQYVIDEFQALGLLDFDNLTLSDEERIEDFFLYFQDYFYSEEVYR
ncbi:PKD domain-containing protein [Mariniplasma anaerobium]|uniref:Uncharacterized protein n=1 Tax=Mariniplasma anaerobium TaxID=2735436 RepID=A0A7U9XUX5_9MOLU|nr:PKD domain-containing protein [Mariniplasma anaerobium]BCR36623.1 hypothetical protein MPAN_015160 [Mariniplasma anaerobium]